MQLPFIHSTIMLLLLLFNNSNTMSVTQGSLSQKVSSFTKYGHVRVSNCHRVFLQQTEEFEWIPIESVKRSWEKFSQPHAVDKSLFLSFSAASATYDQIAFTSVSKETLSVLQELRGGGGVVLPTPSIWWKLFSFVFLFFPTMNHN